MRVAIIADDLTGLNAIASEFHRYGMSVASALNTEDLPTLSDYDVVGVDTNTRGLDPAAAIRIVRQAARAIAGLKPDWIFKQNDSALHGHIAAELEAVIDGTGQDRLIFCPASPSAGRLTVNGKHRTGSQTGAEVDFAQLWRSQGGDPERLSLSAKPGGKILPGVTLADSSSDADIAKVIAHAANGNLKLVGGSVGLAKALARHLWAESSHLQKPVLLLLGSFQGRTKVQTELFLSSTAVTDIEIPATISANVVERSVNAAAQSLSQGRHVVLRPAASAFSEGADGYPYLQPVALEAIAGAMREIGGKLLVSHASILGGVVIAGGSTSEIAAREILGLTAFHNLEYIDDGVAAAQGRTASGFEFPVVTKAGNWGSDDALLRAVQWILAACGNTSKLKMEIRKNG